MLKTSSIYLFRSFDYLYPAIIMALQTMFIKVKLGINITILANTLHSAPESTP